MSVSRTNRLMPNEVPRYIRCYDNDGRTFDRYTIVFTGVYPGLSEGGRLYLSASQNPFHPQGFGQHGSSRELIDYPRYSHLGKKVDFNTLPVDVQKFVKSTYVDLWKLS